jgi:hypothetical protein
MLMLLGWLTLLVVVAIVAVNALFMLISPRAWFRLPKWTGVHGTLTEAKFGSGWGAILVRITGALMLGGIVLALFESLSRHR